MTRCLDLLDDDDEEEEEGGLLRPSVSVKMALISSNLDSRSFHTIPQATKERTYKCHIFTYAYTVKSHKVIHVDTLRTW